MGDQGHCEDVLVTLWVITACFSRIEASLSINYRMLSDNRVETSGVWQNRPKEGMTNAATSSMTAREHHGAWDDTYKSIIVLIECTLWPPSSRIPHMTSPGRLASRAKPHTGSNNPFTQDAPRLTAHPGERACCQRSVYHAHCFG